MAIALAGEDSRHQFKRIVTNADALAAEMAAFLNSSGGTIYVGLEDKIGEMRPLDADAVARVNQLISNAATNNVKPAFDPVVENVVIDGGVVMCVKIPKGIVKPYMTNDGVVWVKVGADKRRVTAKEELLRMFQETGVLHGDEMPVPNTSIADLDMRYFKDVFETLTDVPLASQQLDVSQLLTNMNLLRDGEASVAGMVLFGGESIRYKFPRAAVKVAVFNGTDETVDSYLSRSEFAGKMSDVYQRTISFCMGQVYRFQMGMSVNSAGDPEIPQIVFQELVTNALVHRDFMVNDTVKVMFFRDRIDIVSPGHLPNSLTVTNILSGNSCARNSVLLSYATRLLQFSGFGSGIRRALKAYPAIEFIDERDKNRFMARIKRK